MDGGESVLAKHAEELNQSTIRKLDLILLPFLALLFLFNSLDRTNVGNAESANFTTDVGLEPQDLNTVMAIFYFFFVTLQPLGASVGRKVGMSVFVPTCMSLWGLCTILHIWITSKWQFIALRIVIATLESGFYSTTVSYMSLLYTRYEYARRLGIFYGTYAIAGAFGGLVSYFVFSHFPDKSSKPSSSPTTALKSWQILFLLEGGGTVILAFVGFFWIPRDAGSAWFLSPAEQEWAERRIRIDQKQALAVQATDNTDSNYPLHNTQDEDDSNIDYDLLSSSQTLNKPLTSDRGLCIQDILEAFTDWKLWSLLCCNILSSIPVTAFSIFLPLVLKPLTSSSSPALANILTVPPFLIGAIVLYIFTAYSDRTKQRLVPIIWSLGLLLLGLTGVLLMHASLPRYVALCVLLAGTFPASPLTIAWLANNIPEPGKRSVVLGINGWGNLAGVISSLLFTPAHGPSYTFPLFITFVFVIISMLGYMSFAVLIAQENRARRQQMSAWTEADILAERKYGRGPVEEGGVLLQYTGRTDTLGFRVRMGVASAVAKVARERYRVEIREWVEGKSRRGDERVTFVYTR